MNRIAKLTLASALAVSALAVPVQSQEIVVTSERSVDKFVEEVSSDLTRKLGRAYISPRTNPSGFAIVRFECGANGKPENITLYRGSRDREVNRIAQRAVGRLGSLHPLPGDLRDGQLLQANIVIANSEDGYARLAEQLRRSEEARMASAPGSRPVLAFTAGAVVGS